MGLRAPDHSGSHLWLSWPPGLARVQAADPDQFAAAPSRFWDRGRGVSDSRAVHNVVDQAERDLVDEIWQCDDRRGKGSCVKGCSSSGSHRAGKDHGTCFSCR